MTETVDTDRTSVAKSVSRPRSRKPATVSASALAQHLNGRSYVGKLEAERVIQRQGDGFPLDRSRALSKSDKRQHRMADSVVREPAFRGRDRDTEGRNKSG